MGVKICGEEKRAWNAGCYRGQGAGLVANYLTVQSKLPLEEDSEVSATTYNTTSWDA